MSGQSDLTHNDVMRILQIVDNSEDIQIFVEYEGLKLQVTKGVMRGEGFAAPVLEEPAREEKQFPVAPASGPVIVTSQSAPAAVEPVKNAGQNESGALPEGALAIRAMMPGIFYRAPTPTEPPFVEIGSKVTPDDTVGIVEVMKLFNDIKSGVTGTIVEIRATDENLVEEGEILFIVRPD